MGVCEWGDELQSSIKYREFLGYVKAY